MFTLPNLPYDFSALEPYIDSQTMQIHHDKHHAAYVKNLNDALVNQPELLVMPIEDLIKNLAKVPEDLRTKVRNNGGGHYNHSLFWQIMSPETEEQPAGDFIEVLKSTFGDLATFQEKFTATAIGRFGSGWVWLTLHNGKLQIEDTQNQDNPLMDSRIPILGLDVWEHAYYLKYQNLRADYVAAWWKVVNWKEVEKRWRLLTS